MDCPTCESMVDAYVDGELSARDSADFERALEQTLIAKFRNTGQSCVAANRFIVEAPIASAFTGVSPSEAIAGVGPGCENCASTRLPAAARTTAGKSCLMKTGDVPAT